MTNAARVLHVVRSDQHAHVGGDMVQLDATVEGLRARGLTVHAASIADAPPDIDVVHLYNLQRPAALVHDLRLARRRWPNASVVLSPIWWPWPLRAMASTHNRSLVAKVAKTVLKRSAWWPHGRHVLSSVDLVLPNSNLEVTALQGAFRLSARARDSRRWVVVPNGIHLDRWPEHRADPADRAQILEDLGLDPTPSTVVACVARVEPIKNQLAVVEALRQVTGAALVLIGPPGEARYVAAVEAAGRALGGRSRVVLAGHRAPAEISRILGAVDVHVLASFRETPGLATLEAAATGCAVVVTDHGSAIEYLGDTARVADPVSPPSIAEAIVAAADNPRQPALRQRVERYTWDAAVDAVLAGYERLPGWPATWS